MKQHVGGQDLAARVLLATLILAAVCSCSGQLDQSKGVSPTAPWVPDALIAAVEFRVTVGLRADPDYVAAVAADPTASLDPFGVPLLPAEIEELTRRASTAVAVQEIVRVEAAAFPGDYGGMFIDESDGGVVTLWTTLIEQHEARIRARLDPRFDVVFRRVRFTEQEIAALQARIARDSDWMKEIPARLVSASVNVRDNRVDLFVSSASFATSGLIYEHYAARPGMLRVEIDGTGAALLPWGLVRGRVVNSDGSMPSATDLEVQWASETATYCGIGDRGYPVVAGRFELPCQAGQWTISIIRPGVSDWLEIGHADVIVPSDGEVEVVITLDGG